MVDPFYLLFSSEPSVYAAHKLGRDHRIQYVASTTRGPAPPIVDFVATKYTVIMKTMRYVYWQHDDMWLGYLEESPDYWTQGETLDELQENLKDLYQELTSGNIPEVRRVAKLQLS